MTYNNPQGRIEGFGIDETQARFTGSFELSDEDDEAMSLDRVVVLLVAARSMKLEHTIKDTGDVVARRVLKVSDAMPLTGDRREQAITMMSSHMDPNQGVLWGSTPSTSRLDEPTDVILPATVFPEPVMDSKLEVGYDPETGEAFEPEPEVFRPDAEVIGTLRPGRRDGLLNRFLSEETR